MDDKEWIVKYVKSDYIFGIYIYELPWTPIFLAFPLFPDWFWS